ncbi:unnamed protein product [Ectocarpus sp. 12 AP-2014]
MFLSCFRTLTLVFPSRTKPHVAIGFSGCSHSLSTIHHIHRVSYILSMLLSRVRFRPNHTHAPFGCAFLYVASTVLRDRLIES